jgi:hypothetical protein
MGSNQNPKKNLHENPTTFPKTLKKRDNFAKKKTLISWAGIKIGYGKTFYP